MKKHHISLACVLLVLLSSMLSAQDIYNTSWKLDATVIGASANLFGTSLLIKNSKDPITATQINNLASADLFSLDRSATTNFSSVAGSASDVFRDAIYFVPLTLFLSKGARSEFQNILLMYSEVFALNGALTKVTKEGAGRLRPYAYNENAPLELKLSETTRRSFFSGHTSHVASLSFFTASVFCDLYPDSDFRYLVWAGAITAPAMTAYYRYKAGHHFPTDVMIGYGVGALVGYLIPKLHKSKKMSGVSIIGSGNGMGIAVQF